MRRFLTVLFIVLLGGAIVGGVAFFRAFNQSFPALRPGVYAGSITSQRSREARPLFVESLVGISDLYVAVGDPEVPAQRVVVVAPGGGGRMPLIVVGSHSRLRLSGPEGAHDRYHGTYDDPLSSDRGEWTLERRELSELDPKDAAGSGAWGVAERGLVEAETKLARLGGASAAVAASSSSKLKEVLSFAMSEKTPEAMAGNSAAREEAQRKELEDLARRVEMEQRVSPAGHLVSMSRESIAREGQWIEETLKLSAPAVSADFAAEYERALKVKAIQDQINDERSLIRNLREGPALREQQGRVESEEEFYNGLQ